MAVMRLIDYLNLLRDVRRFFELQLLHQVIPSGLFMYSINGDETDFGKLLRKSKFICKFGGLSAVRESTFFILNPLHHNIFSEFTSFKLVNGCHLASWLQKIKFYCNIHIFFHYEDIGVFHRCFVLFYAVVIVTIFRKGVNLFDSVQQLSTGIL